MPDPFDPGSPEDLICQFSAVHCRPQSYLSFKLGSNDYRVNTKSFILPVDDFFRNMHGLPTLSARIVLGDGPHVYVRFFIATHMWPIDRRKEADWGAAATQMLSNTNDAIGAIEKLLEFASKDDMALAIVGRLPWSLKRAWHFERRRKLESYRKSVGEIEVARKAIETLHNMARERCETSRVRPPAKRGTHPKLWKQDFAYWIVRLWYELFGDVPKSNPDGRFASFLESIWSSIDSENSCPQNWVRPIETAIREIKSELNQIHHGFSA